MALEHTSEMIRRARMEEKRLVYNLINSAYEVEIGCTGVCFKSGPRYNFDVESQLMRDEMEHMYVYVSGDGGGGGSGGGGGGGGRCGGSGGGGSCLSGGVSVKS